MPSSFNPIPPVSNAQYRQQPLVSQSTYSTTQPAYASAQPTYPSVQQINSSNQSTYSTMHPTHNPPIQQQQPVVPPPQISHVHYSNEDMANGVQPRGVAAPTLIGRRAHIGSQHRPWNDPPPISPKQHNVRNQSSHWNNPSINLIL